MIIDVSVFLYVAGFVGFTLWYVIDGVEQDHEAFFISLVTMIFWPIALAIATVQVIREENWRN